MYFQFPGACAKRATSINKLEVRKKVERNISDYTQEDKKRKKKKKKKKRKKKRKGKRTFRMIFFFLSDYNDSIIR